jgi:hypothetical protein
MTQQVWQSIPPTHIYLLQLSARVHAGGLQIVHTVNKSEFSRKPYKVKSVFFLWGNEIKHLTRNTVFKKIKYLQTFLKNNMLLYVIETNNKPSTYSITQGVSKRALQF